MYYRLILKWSTLLAPEVIFQLLVSFQLQIFCHLDLIQRDCNGDGAKRFLGFSSSKGWDISEGSLSPDANTDLSKQWMIMSPHQRSCMKSQFVQRWLFFALLWALFFEDDYFDCEDFIRKKNGSRKEHTITTVKLNEYVARWSQRPRTRSRIARDHSVLQRAQNVVSQYLAVTPGMNAPGWTIDPAVALSIIVLGESLSQEVMTFDSLQHGLTGSESPMLAHEHWGYAALVMSKAEETIKCHSELKAIRAYFEGNSFGPLLAMYCTDHFDDHYSCTDPRRCTRNVADSKDRYFPNGPSGPSPCHLLAQFSKKHRCDFVHSDPAKLQRVIQKGKVPLFRLDEKRAEVSCYASDLTEDYVVFSHCWSDGFGNDAENAIHRCVFDGLKSLCSKLRNKRTGRAPQYFWIDTLALPVGAEYRDERRRGVQMIPDVYSQGMSTIVLDQVLLEEPMYDYVRSSVQITIGSWMSRMWTLQEAFLSRDLRFAFVSSKDADDFVSYSMNDIEQSVHRGAAALSPAISKVAFSYRERILHRWRPQLQDSQASGSNKPFASPEFVADVWKAFQFRLTERRSNETIGLASLFNLRIPAPSRSSSTSLSKRQKEERDEAECDERMEMILRQLAQLHSIPPGIIFANAKSLNRTGFRWAPRTWMSSAVALSPDPISQSPNPLDPRYSRAPSSLSFDPTRNEIRPGDGLEVHFPGFMFTRVDSSARFDFFDNGLAMSFVVDASARSSGYCYSIETTDLMDDIGPQYHTDHDHLAVIALHLDGGNAKTIALLVAVEGESRSHILVRVLRRVWVRALEGREAEEALGSGCRARRVLGEQRWRVIGRVEQRDDPGISGRMQGLSV